MGFLKTKESLSTIRVSQFQGPVFTPLPNAAQQHLHASNGADEMFITQL
jgi:hypothetical protein